MSRLKRGGGRPNCRLETTAGLSPFNAADWASRNWRRIWEKGCLMSYFTNAFGRTLVLALGMAAAVAGPSYADRTATQNERTPAGKLLQMPLIDFVFEAKLISTKQAGDVLKTGDVIGQFEVGVTQTARLKVDTLARRPAYPRSVPAGTILFQVNLDNGVAFCAPLWPDQGVRRSQCFRDLNNDGVFDAGYITDYISRGKNIYGGRLQGLSPMPQTPYELTSGNLIEPEPAELVVSSILGNTIRFDYKLNGVKLTEKECAINSDQPCRLLNQDYRFEAHAGGVRIKAAESLSAS